MDTYFILIILYIESYTICSENFGKKLYGWDKKFSADFSFAPTLLWSGSTMIVYNGIVSNIHGN